MRVFRLPLFVGLVLLSTVATAQVFGGNPPSLKWRQLNTDTARIIFPMGLDSPAQRVAAIVHQLSQKLFIRYGVEEVMETLVRFQMADVLYAAGREVVEDKYIVTASD